MARKYLLVLSLVLVGGVFALVKAQDPNRRPNGELGTPPQILQTAGEADETNTRSILRGTLTGRGLAADRAGSSRRPNTAPVDTPSELSIDQGSPMDVQGSPAAVSDGEPSQDLPSVLKRKTKSSANVNSGSPPPATSNYAPDNSSRRTAALPRPTNTPEVPPTEIAAPIEQPGLQPSQPMDEPQFRSPQPISSGMRAGNSGALMSSAGPALRVETTGPKAVVIGKPTPYSVTIFNDSTVAAQEVHVRVTLPHWVGVATTNASAGSARKLEDAGVERMLWVINSLEPRSQQTLTLQVGAREAREFEMNVDWTFRPVAATAQIEVRQPQLEVVASGPKDVLFGQNTMYVVTVSNPGNGDAENVTVKLTAGQNAPEAIPVGLVPAGTQKQIEVQLAANQPGAMVLRAEVSADGGLKAEIQEQITVRRAQLQIAMAGPKLKFAGAEGAYQLRVANVGNATAEEVTAAIVLPPGTKITALTDGGKQSVNGLAWRIGTLSPGTERIYEVRCELLTSGENRIEGRAQGAGNLSAAEMVTTQVEALADLKLTVNEPKGPRSIAEEGVYEIQIVNRGTKGADNVSVVMHFSDGLEPASAEGSQAELVRGQVAFKSLGRIEAGQQLSLKVRAKAERPGNHRFRVEVQCAEPETQLLSEGVTRFFGEEASTATAPRNTSSSYRPQSQPQVQPATHTAPAPTAAAPSAASKRR